MNIKCRNQLCIYQKNDECILKKIELDINGLCEECIYPEIPENFLEYIKNSTLNKLNKEDEEL